MLLVQAIVSGILMGGIYVLISVGLTMIYGVMDLVNFAHGSFLMLGMYSAFWLFFLWGVSPYLSLLIVPILFFGIGWVMQKALIQRALEGGYMLGQFIITFGLWLVIENSAVIFWHLDPRSLARGAFQRFDIGGIVVTYPMALAFSISIGLSIAFHLFMKRSWTGLALSATAQNRASAEIVGMNVRDTYALAMGIGIAMVSVAGVLLATFFPMTPYVGLYFLIIAFVVAVLGGLGNYAGAMLGGLILGFIEGFFGFMLAPEIKQLAYLFVFIGILALRPQGLLGRKEIRGG
jgi:branched-chain amino acid transport system permease protein